MEGSEGATAGGLAPSYADGEGNMRPRALKNMPPGMEALHHCRGGRKYSYNWYKFSVSGVWAGRRPCVDASWPTCVRA